MEEDQNIKEIDKLKREILYLKEKNLRLIKVERFFYRISKKANKFLSVHKFCAGIHLELKEIINCENFYIALWDNDKQKYSFPYYIDQKDTVDQDTYLDLENSLTDFVRKEGRPYLITSSLKKKLIETGKVTQVGHPSSIWIGAPLFFGRKDVIGVVAIQDYENKFAYNKKDLALLGYIARNIGLVIELFQARNASEKANMLKSQFLANVSHEVRTPMNSIMGFASLLTRYKDSKVVEHADIIVNNGQQLLNLINDVLDLSLIESGNVILHPKTVNLNTLLEKILKSFRNTVSVDKKYAIHIRLDDIAMDQQCFVYIDEKRVRQLLDNLISNAIKFTEKGKIIFGYKIENKLICFYVKDEGKGIDKENKARVFDQFYRIEDIQMPIEGQGLGLAICKSLIEKMGGNIWIEDNIPQGSIFRFTIPYMPVTNGKEILPKKNNHHNQQQKKNFSFLGKTIMLVDDDKGNMALLERYLRKTNIKILKAYSGKQAIELALTNSDLSLILMDCKMERNKAGIEASKEILIHKMNMPIILQTAHILEEIKIEAMDVGCVESIVKPIEQQDLLQMIENHILGSKEGVFPSFFFD